MLRVGRARRRRDRAAARSDRILDRPHRRRLSQLRHPRPIPTGAACKAACEDDNRCRAWTYVRPGYIGPSARCYLKDKITRPRHKPCCISGVVR